ncbi:MAG: DotD/TraH family lipoprotein, partial [Alphaproteobacteria bacterium]|nr:DotD/TraH family lipoprotein [Alphaproteobacteria bacterium]
KAGYQFQTVGDKPGTPVVVTINAVNQPVIEVLRDIGLQLGQRGDVRVDGSARIVEIHYPPHSAHAVGVGDPF